MNAVPLLVLVGVIVVGILVIYRLVAGIVLGMRDRQGVGRTP